MTRIWDWLIAVVLLVVGLGALAAVGWMAASMASDRPMPAEVEATPWRVP